MSTQTQTRIARISFETSECSRCGGEGRIQAFGHVHGGTCFGCNGSGRRFTSKGRAAHRKAEAWKAEHTTVLVSDIALGDRIYVTNMRGRRVAVTVTDITTSTTVSYRVDGEQIPAIDLVTTDAHGNVTSRGHLPGSTQGYQRVLTQDDLQALAAHLARNTGAVVDYAA